MVHSKPERRSRQRLPMRLPVAITSPPGSLQTSGHTRDLSTNGIFLYADSALAEGSELEMVLILPPELTQGEKCWVCCQAVVVRVEQGVEGGQGVAASIRNIQVMPEIPG